MRTRLNLIVLVAATEALTKSGQTTLASIIHLYHTRVWSTQYL
jgi:hypothetical protein